jgi:hypothetical protein
MPAIVATDASGTGTTALTETTLDGATDSLVYNAAKGPLLILDNPTAGALSPVIDGADGTTIPCDGVGDVDVSSGFAVGSIAVGDSVAIKLGTIRSFLQGTVSITGGTGLVATLLEF